MRFAPGGDANTACLVTKHGEFVLQLISENEEISKLV